MKDIECGSGLNYAYSGHMFDELQWIFFDKEHYF